METVGGAAMGVGMVVATGEIVGAAEGVWPPAVAATMQMNARRNPREFITLAWLLLSSLSAWLLRSSLLA